MYGYIGDPEWDKKTQAWITDELSWFDAIDGAILQPRSGCP